jgi:hydroxymethylpyrimidine/phosphomethylpyrimidine kinase
MQADLKTFAACGIHGVSVLTVATAQNTVDVQGMQVMPDEFVRSQFRAVVDDFQPSAAKTGALGSASTIRAVAELFDGSELAEQLVVDPVMISKHGDPLLPEEAREVMVDYMVPIGEVVTPNRHEAEALTGERVTHLDSMKEAAKRIYDLGVEHVLIKGSHLENIVKDILYDGSGFIEYGADKVDTTRLHGSGCVYSSAIAARLAIGDDLPEAIGFARDFITQAIEEAPKLGHGVSPVHPMYAIWDDEA